LRQRKAVEEGEHKVLLTGTNAAVAWM
jgi:hypothetical protein